MTRTNSGRQVEVEIETATSGELKLTVNGYPMHYKLIDGGWTKDGAAVFAADVEDIIRRFCDRRTMAIVFPAHESVTL